jgi:Cof subfamily protein (haloacid dehalogenase superfamily)
VFLDVDGTYAHHGVVPPAHEAAVRAVRSAGHLVVLCTGRPKAMVPPHMTAAGLDGFVGGAGAYVEVGGRVLADVRFPVDAAARAVEVLDAHDAAYILEGPDLLLARPGTDERLAALFAARVPGLAGEVGGGADILARLTMSDDLTGASFGKVTCFDGDVPIDLLAAEIGPGIAALPSSIVELGDAAGELYLASMHKAVGLRIAAEALGVALADVIAVGDGLNDVEMLAAAGTGVAIEGADPAVLAVADRVAAGPEHDGLVALFAELGLL